MNTRRNFLAASTTLVSSASLIASRTAAAQTSAKGRTFVLVHGAWHGAWCWKRVSDRLQASGHRVVALTLTGVGSRAHLLTKEVDLQTHIQDVIGEIDAEELMDVVLIGHSYGGIIISGVADRIPQRLSRLIYLDSVVIKNGESWSSPLPPDAIAFRAKQAEATSGLALPAPTAAQLGVIESRDQAWVDRRMTPHPYSTFLQKIEFKNPIGNGLPKTYIDCANPALRTLVALKADLRKDPAWQFATLQTGHDAMVSAPAELAELLQKIA